METGKSRFELPKWLCVLAVLAGGAAAGIQLAIDIRQGLTPDLLPDERMIQIGQMSLPTVFVVVLGAIAGIWVSNGHWKWSLGLYLAAAICMAVTATNGMDFLANKTVARTQAQIKQATAERDIAEIKNSIVLQERKEKQDNLWRTYLSAKPGIEKDKVLGEIKAATQEDVNLKSEVGVVQVGVGSSLTHHFGWRPEAIQEARAVAIPIVTMVLKAMLISIGFGCWPGTAAKQWQATSPLRVSVPGFQETTRKLSLSYEAACEDLRAMIAAGASVPSQQALADRWNVGKGQVSKWKPRFRRDGIPFEIVANGNKRAVVAPTHHNGNGRLAGTA